MPRRIEFTDGSIVRYTYAATGEKLRTDYHINPLAASASAGMAAPRVDSTNLVHTWRTYTGNRIYDNDSLSMILVDGGYITFGGNKPQYHFYLRDHLGNNRVVADIDGNVEEVNHYYPYGALMDIGGSDNTTQPYKYVGKELDRTHGLDWYDHGARMNDPLTLRWNGIDKRAEEYVAFSPYSVCADNPTHYVDTNGKYVLVWFLSKKGESTYFKFDGTQKKMPMNQFVADFVNTYFFLKRRGIGGNVVKAVENNKLKINVQESEYNSRYDSSDATATVFWQSRKGLKTTEGGHISPATILEHEFDHAVDDSFENWKNHRAHTNHVNTYDSQYQNMEEKRVITRSERRTARKLGESIRHNHDGTIYDVLSPTTTKPKL